MPEAWLRGPVEGIPPLLMPVAHTMIQIREELDEAVSQLSDDQIWARPGNAASVGFHLLHIEGATDRLLTYARGESLSEAQMAAIRTEKEPGDPPPTGAELLGRVDGAVERVLSVLRETPEQTLLEPRSVGRAQLPTTVLGLLFHVAEHAQRHTGQVATTIRALD